MMSEEKTGEGRQQEGGRSTRSWRGSHWMPLLRTSSLLTLMKERRTAATGMRIIRPMSHLSVTEYLITNKTD